jgi:hypothetical protein
MDSFFFACTVAAVGALILSLIFSEKSKVGERSLGLLAMRTGGDKGDVAAAPASRGKKKQRPKVGEALVRRPQRPPMPKGS